MNSKQQLMEMSLNVNNLLLQYVAIHNDVFKTSIRRIIPLPFIFNTIDFEGHHGKAENILSQLEEANASIGKILCEYDAVEREYLELLSQYVTALIETVKRLKTILVDCMLKVNASQATIGNGIKKIWLNMKLLDKHTPFWANG